MAETYKKIDDKTVEITTTVPPTVVERDKAELQTELDHIPDRLAELQEQIDEIDTSQTRLTSILKVFE
jgi:hypothetical protein